MRTALTVATMCLLVGCSDDGGGDDGDDSPPVPSLAFVVQPSSGEYGKTLLPVSVAFVDEAGDIITTEEGPVTLSLDGGDAPTSLEGTTVVNAQDGIATFDQLVITAPASQVVLEASADAVASVTSAPFDVTFGDPSTLSSITAEPESAVADGLGEVSIIVTLRNADGLAIPDYEVTLSASGTHNTFYPAPTGTTNAQGQVEVVLRSTKAEAKTVTATAGSLELTAPVSFSEPPCTPLLGGLPSTLMPDNMRTLRAIDLDGDGHLDLVFVESTYLVVMRGLGNGRFRLPERYATGTRTFAVAAGDFDNDGDVDVIAARRDAGELITFSNMGNGVLAQHATLTVATPLAVEATDLNEDGTTDVIVRSEHDLSVLLGMGNGSFQAPATYSLPIEPASTFQAWIAIGDVNNDGHLDVVTSDSNWSYDVLLGSASGALQSLPSVYAGEGVPVALGDLDGDDVADLATGLAWWHGNGDGTFGTRTDLSPLRDATFVMITDINGDGRLDILGGSGGYAPFALDLVLGNGDGTFQPDELRALSFIPQFGTIGDFDEDGRPDVAVAEDMSASDHALSILLGSPTNTLSGITVHGTLIGPGGAYFAPKVADFDNSGTLDFVGVDRSTRALGVQLSAPDLTLTAMPTVSGPFYGTNVAIADFNGDAKPDVVWADGATLQWMRGHGDGNLDNPVATSTPHYASALKAVDVDGNGVLDLVMANQAQDMIAVALGNGDGTFGSSATYAIGDTPREIDSDDLDGDGDQDLIVANSGSGISVLINQGDGAFAAATNYGMAGTPYSVAVADLDGDGNHDLAVANGSPANTIIFFKGHGDGTFEPAAPIQVGLPTSWIEVFDVDSDGIPDLVANYRGLVVLRGNGDGTFQAPLFYEMGGGGAGAVGDFDADGRVDIMVPQYDMGVGFLLLRNGGCG